MCARVWTSTSVARKTCSRQQAAGGAGATGARPVHEAPKHRDRRQDKCQVHHAELDRCPAPAAATECESAYLTHSHRWPRAHTGRHDTQGNPTHKCCIPDHVSQVHPPASAGCKRWAAHQSLRTSSGRYSSSQSFDSPCPLTCVSSSSCNSSASSSHPPRNRNLSFLGAPVGSNRAELAWPGPPYAGRHPRA